MGKVKAWVMSMEEDAEVLTAQEFVDKHGKMNLDIWSKVQWELGKSNIQEQYLAVCKTEGDA
jgi:hypothetical protein|tara:strand:+ start:245 stop:430 length:186 start_codon:yes stop_codon:yes gene_type:complete